MKDKPSHLGWSTPMAPHQVSQRSPLQHASQDVLFRSLNDLLSVGLPQSQRFPDIPAGFGERYSPDGLHRIHHHRLAAV
jgi:hypothetical protein